MADRAIGIDLALRHGSIIDLELSQSGLGIPITRKAEVLGEWGKKKRFTDKGIGQKTPNSTAAIWMTKMLTPVLQLPGTFPVVLDWTPLEGFMPGRAAVILKSFLVGVAMALITSHGKVPLVIGGREVRTLFQLKANRPKEEIWQAYYDEVVLRPVASELWTSEDLTEDSKDAWVLAYLGWKAIERIRSG